MFSTRAVTVIIAALLSWPVLATDTIGDALRRMRKLDTDVAEPAQKAPQLEQWLTDVATSPALHRLDGLTDDQVRDYYDAARLAAFYGNRPATVIQTRRAWNELDRRRIASAGSADDMLQLYEAARLFDDARQFHEAHKDQVSRPPPALVDLDRTAAQPTVLSVAGDGTTLIRQRFSRLDGTAVIIVGSPWCHFSRAAAESIENDTALGPLMAKQAAWLIPQQVVSDFGSVVQWNRKHPSAAMSLIDRQNEWPFIHTVATPTFYFFKDGKLVSSFSGWTGDEQKVTLRERLRLLEPR
jgi:hypothetical protein